MKLNIPTFEASDDRAVSPVIGVILMVAITVILAAVIGAFVLNLGSNVGNSTPQASLSMSDAGHAFNGSNNTTQEAFYINHQSGDTLQLDNIKIVIQDSSGRKIGNLSTANNWNDSTFKLNFSSGSSINSGDTLSTGDQLAMWANPSGRDVKSGTSYKLLFIDQQSGRTITTTKATLN